METNPATSSIKYFSNVEDPRVDRTKLHKLMDILVIAICAVICGADGWKEVDFSVSPSEPGSKQFWN
jgi:hypothetical protein